MSTSSYKMSKQLKVLLAMGKWDSKEHKNECKKIAIRAEIIAQSKPKASSGERKNAPSNAKHGDSYVG